MRRRDFIKAVAGSTAVWPLAAGAEQRERIRSVGVLTPFSPHDFEGQNRVTAFVQALQQLGWSVGPNIQIALSLGRRRRSNRNRRSMRPRLVALAPDVILATGSADFGTAAAGDPRHCRSCSRMVADPVGAGYGRKLGAAGRQRHRFYHL